MIRPTPPPWFAKAKEIAARTPSPVGRPFAAAKKTKTCLLHLYDAIGRDPWGGGGIDPMDVVKALADAGDAEELEVHVNSPGGFVFDGITIYNAIRGFKGTKTVHVDGLAASIASVIALAGDRVVTNEGALWMVHDPMGGIFSFGTADQIEDDAKKTVQALRAVRDTILDIYVNRTKQARSDLSAWMSDETWMSADEAKARGFTDEVIAAEACDCACTECEADNCPECSCGGCDACGDGGGCNGGDCPQGGAKDDATHHPKKKNSAATPARALTPEELVARARADVADIHQRFGGASPVSKPGEPGKSNAAKPDTRQEQAR
jgi:ATP-dependent protease ClpP protease subunit